MWQLYERGKLQTLKNKLILNKSDSIVVQIF